MAHHGYLREFDETYDRDEDRASGWRNREGERGLLFGGERRAGVSSHSDEHYRSWRDQQMRAMDRDYADYRREREEQFHHDFDSWRSRRHGNPQPLRTGMTQTGLSHDPTGMREAASETEGGTPEGPDPMAAATPGTSSRRRRRR